MLEPPTLPPIAITPLAQPAPVLTYETPVLPSIESASDDAFFAAAEFQLDVSNSPVVVDDESAELDYTFGLPAILDITPQIPTIDTEALLASVASPLQDPAPDFVPTEALLAPAVPLPIEEPTPDLMPFEVSSADVAPVPVEDPTPEFVPTPMPVAAPSPEMAPAVTSDAYVEPASAMPSTPVASPETAPLTDAPDPTLVAAPQALAGIPSLPDAGPSPLAPTGAGPALGTQPSQAGMRAPIAMSEPLTPAVAVAARAPRRPVRAMVRSLAAVVLAGSLGAGAHLGYDWWESSDVAETGEVPVDASDLASWPVVDPPAIRYADTVTVVRDITGHQRVVTSHLEIATGSMLAEVDTIDASGVSFGQTTVEIRGDEALTQLTPGAPLTPMTRAEAMAALGDSWNSDIHSVRELFPTALLPYATVLESVERVLPVAPLVAPAALVEVDPEVAPDSTVPIATSTTPSSSVWQYRVIVDIEAFRSNDMAAYQEWQRRVGRNAVPRIEAWVDAAGIVRQITVEIDGRTVTQTLLAGSSNSDRFVSPAPVTPVTPVAPVTPDPAAAPEPDVQPEVES